MPWWATYALALGLTIVIETLLACALRRQDARRLAVDVPLMNLITHPLLHLGMSFGLLVPLGELLVMAVEAVLYRTVTRLSLRWSIWLSVGLNALTWFLGWLLF